MDHFILPYVILIMTMVVPSVVILLFIRWISFRRTRPRSRRR